MATVRLREFLRGLRDARTELAIPVATVIVILVLADVVVMAVLLRVAPAFHAQVASVPASTRRWIVGAPPALLYLAVVASRLWRATRAS